MVRLELGLRYLLMVLLIALPAALVLGGVAGWRIAFFGWALGSWVVLISGARVESWVARHLKQVSPAQLGLMKSLDRSTSLGIANSPRLWIYEEPAPNVLVVRGWYGKGAVFASQGFLDQVSEKQLRETIDYSIQLCRAPETVLRSLGAQAVSRILSWAPRAWVEVVFGAGPRKSNSLTPTTLLGFLLVFPWARGVRKLTNARRSVTLRPGSEFSELMSRIQDQLGTAALLADPGIETLCLCRPASGNRLLSL